MNISRKLAAEFLGKAFLLALIIGSDIKGERLAGGNVAIALRGNTLATGGIDPDIWSHFRFARW